MANLLDDSADSVPEWDWESFPSRVQTGQLGETEMAVPTSDPNEIEIMMPYLEELPQTTPKFEYTTIKQDSSTSDSDASFDILDPVFQAKTDAMWQWFDDTFPEFVAWKKLRATEKKKKKEKKKEQAIAVDQAILNAEGSEDASVTETDSSGVWCPMKRTPNGKNLLRRVDKYEEK